MLDELGKSDQGNCGTVTLVPLTLLKKPDDLNTCLNWKTWSLWKSVLRVEQQAVIFIGLGFV